MDSGGTSPVLHLWWIVRSERTGTQRLQQIGFCHLPKDIQAKLKQRKAEADNNGNNNALDATAIEQEF